MKRTFLLAVLLFAAAAVAQQVNPHSQIHWPANCNSSNYMTYNVLANTCILVGPVGASGQVQYNSAGAWGVDAGFTYSGGVLTVPNLTVPGTSNMHIPPSGVQWPPTCSSGVYSPATNTCVSTGSANNPGGSAGQLQFNSGGNFGGVAGSSNAGPNGLSVTGLSITGTPSNLTDAATVGYVGPHGAQWRRQGIVVTPSSVDLSPQVQETSAMWDSSPEVLTTRSQVVKMTFTCGWYPTAKGGNGVGVCGGESPDGLTPPTRVGADPIIVDHARSYLLPVRIAGKLRLYASDIVNADLDIYEGTTLAGLTRIRTNVLKCGTGGSGGRVGSEGNTVVFPTDATGHANNDWSSQNWTMLYDCLYSTTDFADYRATSTDGGLTWTPAGTQAVILGDSSAKSAQCSEGGGPFTFTRADGKLDVWVLCGPSPGPIPTPYIYHLVDSTGVGNAFVIDAAPVLVSTMADEGVNMGTAQIADIHMLSIPTSNSTIMYYTAYTNGCPSPTCTIPSYIKAATINLPLAQIVTMTQSDGGPSLLNDINQAGAGYTPIPPASVDSPGAGGQYSTDSNFFYMYERTTAAWKRIAWDSSWTSLTTATPNYSPDTGSYYSPVPVIITDATAGASIVYCMDTVNTCSPASAYSVPVSVPANNYLRASASHAGLTTSSVKSSFYQDGGYQTQDLFIGTGGTLATAHADLSGKSWSVYTADGSPGVTSPFLDGTGQVYLPTGTSTANNGDVLNSLTPSSANYTASIACTSPGVISGTAALFVRANNAANTNYVATLGYGTVAGGGGSQVALFKVVSGTVTQLGTTYSGAAIRPWTTNAAHGFTVQVNGTTITVSVDGTAVITQTDAAISTAGQAGFRVTGGSSMYCRNFSVK